MKKKKSYALAVECLAIAAMLMLICSCLSFDIRDWPSPYAWPHNSPTANWCGPIGAFLAFYTVYYIGPGIFVLLISCIAFLVARVANFKITQPVFRGIGLGLLTVAVSSSFYFFWPYRLYSFPMGSGGILGVGTVYFLRTYFAMLGTFILITATWIVGCYYWPMILF